MANDPFEVREIDLLDLLGAKVARFRERLRHRQYWTPGQREAAASCANLRCSCDCHRRSHAALTTGSHHNESNVANLFHHRQQAARTISCGVEGNHLIRTFARR